MARVTKEPEMIRCGPFEVPAFLAIEPIPQRLAERINSLELCTFDGEFHPDEEATLRTRARLIAACPDLLGQMVVHPPPGFLPTLYRKMTVDGKLLFVSCPAPSRIEHGYILGTPAFERYVQLTHDRRRPRPVFPWPRLPQAYHNILSIYPLV